MDERDFTGEWDYGALPPNVQLGKSCFLERRDSFKRFRSTRQPGLVLGDRVRVFTWTAFDVQPTGRVVVGDDAVLVGVTFMCADSITIGKRVILSYQVMLADCDFHPRDPTLRLQDAMANAPLGDRSQRLPLVARPIVIEDDAWVGIGAIILKGVRVAAGARVAAGSVVTADVAPGVWVAGNPARPAGAGGRLP